MSTIVGDTLANGHTYFIRRDSIPAVGTLGPFVHTFYVRYDSAETVVTLPSLEADSMSIPLRFDYRRTEWPDHLAHFNMQSSFGDTLYYKAASPPSSFTDTLFWVTGSYNATVQIGNENVLVNGQKCFREKGFSAGRTECYATDIGYTGGGNLFASELRYAKVGGVEYGEHHFTSLQEDVPLPDQLRINGIFPNPAIENATINFQLSRPSAITIEVFDVLGKRLSQHGLSYLSAGLHRSTIAFTALNSGMYFVRLKTEYGEEKVRSLIVSK